MSTQATRREINRVYLESPKSRTLPKSDRPDFSERASTVGKVARDLGLPDYTKHWTLKPDESFWSATDIQIADLPDILRQALWDNIERAESSD